MEEIQDQGGWQPIETAPTIEWIQIVLLSRDHGSGGVMPAVFDGEKWRGLSIVGMIPYVEPTHWMPLPAPPPHSESN